MSAELKQRCSVPDCRGKPEYFIQLEPHGKIYPLCEAHGDLRKRDAEEFKKFVVEWERSRD